MFKKGFVKKHTSCISWLRNYCTVRSSCLQMFFKKGALKTLSLIKLQLQHRYFSVKLLRTPFFKEHLRWLLLYCKNYSIQKHSNKKHNHNMVSYNYLGSPTQTDFNSRRSQYSHVFFILCSCFNSGKFEKTVVTCNIT